MQGASQVDFARLAAFIDGEGGIYLKPASSFKGKYKTLYLSVCVINTDPRLVQWCVRNFGGKIQRRYKKATMSRDCFEWEVFCKDAELILRACLPYFIIKKGLAELALAHQATLNVGGKKVSPETRVRRQEIKQQMLTQRFRLYQPDDDIPVRAAKKSSDMIH